MSEEDIYDELWETEWVRIPENPFTAKFKFQEDGYIILISDLSDIFGEKLTETEVQERFCVLNPYAEMKSKVIIKHVKQSLEDCLSNASKIKLASTPSAVTIRLQFVVSQVFFIFDVKAQMLPCKKLRTHLIAPTVLTALSLHQENLLLKQKIKNMEKEKPAAPTVQKYEHGRISESSKILKKGKLLATDILESFLNLQQTIQNCISESKVFNVDPTTQATSSSMLLSSNINCSPQKAINEDFSLVASLKYEDVQHNATSTHEKESVTSNTVEKCEITSFAVKREIEDSSKSETDSIQAQIHTKLKKKKCFKF